MDEVISIEIPELSQRIIDELAGHALPDSDLVSNWALEKERKVYFDIDVGADLLAIQRLILRWNMEDRGIPASERKPIWLYIFSYGGDIDYMWSALDTIKTSVTPIYTVNLGVAASAAALIFISGHKRFMMPSAKVTIHEGSAQLSGDAVKVMDQSESYKKQLKQMKMFVLENTEIPRAQLMKKRNNDWELDAAYCMEHKVCEQIVSTMDDII
jgi:ATP-dependent Clp protease protease subunit